MSIKDTTDGKLTEVDPQVAERVEVDDVPFAREHDRYERLGRLGKGGMGEVRLYKDKRISRQVAVKVLRESLRNDKDYRARFLSEARLQGQLEHPSIVPVHDLGETPDGELFFSMKCVRGVTLAKAMKGAREGAAKFSRRRLITAFSSVCLAVDFAHTRGVVHRDLKPENIMLGDFGEVYVLDWGIAKVMHGTDTPMTDLDGVIAEPGETPTRAGMVLGTPRYIAPERKTGQADARTDVFSLGVILGDILEADSDFDIPPELVKIERGATAPDPLLRYQTARELHDALERFLDGDRDLEARKRLSEEHAIRAEVALHAARMMPSARSDAGREVGRALGLDPSNRRALGSLMRLLTDLPAEPPPAVQAELDRRWVERRSQMLRVGTYTMGLVLVLIPFMLWMGVRDWSLFGAYVGLTVAALTFIRLAAFTATRVFMPAAIILWSGALFVLNTSAGLLGVVPAAITLGAIAWRMNVQRTLHGVLILLVALSALLAPFGLAATGIMSPNHVFAADMIQVLPKMHAFPPVPTFTYLMVVTVGIVSAALFYGRLYMIEIRRAEVQLTFQAWQLQQLVPPEHKLAAA